MTNSRAGNRIQTKIKLADVTRNSTDTLTIDNELQISLNIGTYLVTFNLFVDSGTTPDFQYSAMASTGTMTASCSSGAMSALIPVVIRAIDTAFQVSTTAVVEYIQCNIALKVTAAGIFGLGWSQATSDAGATKLLQGSSMMIIKA